MIFQHPKAKTLMQNITTEANNWMLMWFISNEYVRGKLINWNMRPFSQQSF